MRGRFRKKSVRKEDMVLQITSMADIFTIILVFLLKSFSTGLNTISPDVILPEANAKDEIRETVKVEIGEAGITIDGKQVTNLDHFQFDTKEMEDNQTPRSLNQALIAEYDVQKKSQTRAPASTDAPAAAEPAPAGPSAIHLMVLADQKTPYQTLKTVLASAANSGFDDFKLLIVQQDGGK